MATEIWNISCAKFVAMPEEFCLVY